MSVDDSVLSPTRSSSKVGITRATLPFGDRVELLDNIHAKKPLRRTSSSTDTLEQSALLVAPGAHNLDLIEAGRRATPDSSALPEHTTVTTIKRYTPIITETALSIAGSYAKSLLFGALESLGLPQIFRGGGSLLLAQPRLIWNSISTIASGVIGLAQGDLTLSDALTQIKEGLKEAGSRFVSDLCSAGSLVIGAVKFLGQMTGVTDLILTGVHGVRALKHALNGDWDKCKAEVLQTLVHAGCMLLAAGTLAATFATGGALAGALVAVAAGRASLTAALGYTLSVAAREFLAIGAREVGKGVVKELSEKISPEALKLAGQEIATNGATQLGEKCLKSGTSALTDDVVFTTLKEVAVPTTTKLLKEAGAEKIVERLTFEFLTTIKERTVGELSTWLLSKGVASEATATLMAQNLQAALARGATDEAMKKILVQGITEEVGTFLIVGMESGFKKRFSALVVGDFSEVATTRALKALADAAKERAAILGLSIEQFALQITEVAWKGAQRGILEAAEAIVLEGVTRAFKRFRKRETQEHRESKNKEETKSSSPLENQSGQDFAHEQDLSSKLDKSRTVAVGVLRTKTVDTPLPNGKIHRVISQLQASKSGEEWRVVSEIDLDATVER